MGISSSVSIVRNADVAVDISGEESDFIDDLTIAVLSVWLNVEFEIECVATSTART